MEITNFQTDFNTKSPSHSHLPNIRTLYADNAQLSLRTPSTNPVKFLSPSNIQNKIETKEIPIGKSNNFEKEFNTNRSFFNPEINRTINNPDLISNRTLHQNEELFVMKSKLVMLIEHIKNKDNTIGYLEEKVRLTEEKLRDARNSQNYLKQIKEYENLVKENEMLREENNSFKNEIYDKSKIIRGK